MGIYNQFKEAVQKRIPEVKLSFKIEKESVVIRATMKGLSGFVKTCLPTSEAEVTPHARFIAEYIRLKLK